MPTPSAALPDVLDRIDAELDNSVGRLFYFLRIQSVSTDPAYAPQCKAAAEFVAKDLASLGFDASLRPTGGHPAVVAKANGAANGKAPHVLFYGHYDVQPVDPLDQWETPPFSPRIATLPDGEPVGFVIEMENGFKVYHAGDTAVFGDMRLIGEMHKPEIAFLPIGDHYTMGPDAAARAAAMLGVRQVVPMHYGTFPLLSGTPEQLEQHLAGKGIEVLKLKPGETAQ